MNSSMIGKIEKAHRYAQEPERITFNSLTASFRGGHDDYQVSLTEDGWTCTCHTYSAHMVETCSHIMALQQILRPMLKEDDRFETTHAHHEESALTGAAR